MIIDTYTFSFIFGAVLSVTSITLYELFGYLLARKYMKAQSLLLKKAEKKIKTVYWFTVPIDPGITVSEAQELIRNLKNTEYRDILSQSKMALFNISLEDNPMSLWVRVFDDGEHTNGKRFIKATKENSLQINWDKTNALDYASGKLLEKDEIRKILEAEE